MTVVFSAIRSGIASFPLRIVTRATMSLVLAAFQSTRLAQTLQHLENYSLKMDLR